MLRCVTYLTSVHIRRIDEMKQVSVIKWASPCVLSMLTICDARHLIFECMTLDALRVEYACLFAEPNPTVLSFMQNDMHAVIHFIDVALGMSVFREAELPPDQPDVVGSV